MNENVAVITICWFIISIGWFIITICWFMITICWFIITIGWLQHQRIGLHIAYLYRPLETLTATVSNDMTKQKYDSMQHFWWDLNRQASVLHIMQYYNNVHQMSHNNEICCKAANTASVFLVFFSGNINLLTSELCRYFI